jgi:hypothetical protein
MSEDQESEYGLVMPFVNVVSKGGPYDDTAYVAGWAMGGLDARLEHRRLARVSETIRTADASQADLLAMKHGYSVKLTDTDYDEWTFAEFVRLEVDS